MSIRPLSVQQLRDWLRDDQRPAPQLLDVREAWELARAALPDALHIPLKELPHRHQQLSPQGPLVVLCHHGGRSQMACQLLAAQGFTDLYNLEGGIHAWALQVDQSVPVY